MGRSGIAGLAPRQGVRRALKGGRGLGVLLAGCLASVALAGCASLRGSADPVVPLQTRLEQVRSLPESRALKNYYAPDDEAGDAKRSGLTREDYRNYVADIYMGAADARYDQFKAQLSRQVRGSGFGASTTVLVLNGLAVVSGIEGARALAVAANVVSGANSALTSQVFNDKTLQALLAAMDGNRATVKIRIRTGLQRPVGQYSLRDALDDIRDLEAQASLDSAIQQLTTLATADTAAKKAKLKTLYKASVLDKPDFDALNAVEDYIDNLAASSDAADLDRLKAMAQAAKVQVGDTPQQTRANLIEWLNAPAQSDHPDQVIATFKPVTKKDTY